MKSFNLLIIKNFFLFFFIFLIFSVATNSSERSEKEIKLGIFLEDLDQFGNFKEINYAPDGMFPEKANTFYKKQIISQKEFIKIFVKQKGLMEKYTDRVILGMAHFEFFYMQQLKENEKTINKFKDKYPKIGAYTKKNIKKIYGLNKAKKSMREALGLSLNDDVNVAIQRYYVLYKLLNQAEIKTIKLSKKEKSKRKLHSNISKNISNGSPSPRTSKQHSPVEENKCVKKYNSHWRLCIHRLCLNHVGS